VLSYTDTVTPQPSIAHYRITTKLGEGGMGAVYRATDTKLARDVAIKILPDSFAADPDRLARFTREAQVVASLNHPNIAAIYGVEDRALVLELVEGPTLAERIAQGAIPLDEALPIARQIAEALEYAHDKGIVHRDLKPANIKITPEGRVKVLDFGLAKAMANDVAAGDPTSSPTMTMRATMAGLIMGTAGYMAPEQAKGKAVDRRADIWAFGIVFAEMLTGRTMYTGETVSEILAAVIMTPPGIPEGLPPHIATLLRRCLERDPSLRLQAIGEARIAIDRPPAVEPEIAAVPQKVRSPRLWKALTASLAVALASAAGVLFYVTRPIERPLQRFVTDMGPEAISGTRVTAILSPDGARIVYRVQLPGAVAALATRLLDESKFTILPGTENVFEHFFSADGQWVGFYADQKLKKVSVHGGAAVTLCDAQQLRGATWGDDGFIYSSLDGVHLYRVPASGGKPELLTQLPDSDEHANHFHRWPQFLSAGALIVTAGSGSATGTWEDSDIEVFSLKTRRFQTVQRGGYGGRYLPSGHLVYIHQGTMFAVGFDPGRMATRGTPVPVVEEVAGAVASGAGEFDFSRTGTLVYLSGKESSEALPFVWLDAAGGKKLLMPAGTKLALSPRLSPDGTKLGLTLAGDLAVYDPARGSTLRLSFDAGLTNQYPVWTPDGKHIVYSTGAAGIKWTRSDGSGQAQLLYPSKGGSAVPTSFSPDGRWLAFHQSDPANSRDIWMLPLDLSDPDHPKPGAPELFLATPKADVEAQFSPDGRWIAYSSAESGAYEVYVRPFPARADGGKWQVSTHGGRFPLWSRTAKELFYVDAGRIAVVPYTVSGAVFAPGPSRRWSDATLSFSGNLMPYDLAPDGKRVVASLAHENEGASKVNLHLTFLLNFFDELKRRVP
jgi:hypothetical protein